MGRVPTIKPRDPEMKDIRSLSEATRYAFDKLFRPIPPLACKWGRSLREASKVQQDGNDAVRAFNKECDQLANAVIKRVRDRLKLSNEGKPSKRLSGVTCTPMMAAKMFGPWCFDFDLNNEKDYSKMFTSTATGIYGKRRDYFNGDIGVGTGRTDWTQDRENAKLKRSVSKLEGALKRANDALGEHGLESVHCKESNRSVATCSNASQIPGPSRRRSINSARSSPCEQVPGASVSSTRDGRKVRCAASSDRRDGSSCRTSDSDPRGSPRRESGRRSRAGTAGRRSGNASSRSRDTMSGRAPPAPAMSSFAPSSGRDSGRGKRERTPQSTGPGVKRSGPPDTDHESARNGAAPIGASSKRRKRECSASSSPRPSTDEQSADEQRRVEKVVEGPKKKDGRFKWKVQWAPVWLSDSQCRERKSAVAEILEEGRGCRRVRIETWEPRPAFFDDEGGVTRAWVDYETKRHDGPSTSALAGDDESDGEAPRFIVREILKGPTKRDGVMKWKVDWRESYLSARQFKPFKGDATAFEKTPWNDLYVTWKPTWESEDAFTTDDGVVNEAFEKYEEVRRARRGARRGA
jgi:hypothetical protein